MDTLHGEKSLLPGQDAFEEVFGDENVRREIELDWKKIVNKQDKLTALLEVLQEIGFASELANQLAGVVQLTVTGVFGVRVDERRLHCNLKL